MTELMQLLFDYALEALTPDLLPREYYWHNQRLLEAREHALLDALAPEQRNLLEAYESAECDRIRMEQQALFQASLALARSLRAL